MSNGKNPLMLMMALSMPGAANALGLGDIHVESGLNERLAAEIDIVGATESDLSDLRAAVANRETFLRYGADRPGFLSSASFKVTQDRQGRPVLAVRSTEAFTEPLVNFLVDVHWRFGDLVRQYTLLLDPPGFSTPVRPGEPIQVAAAASVSGPAAPDVPAAPPAATALAESEVQTTARQVDLPSDPPDTGGQRDARKMTHVKVGAKATLRGIAWRVGERSPSDLQRMMIAIFRANPSAFAGNINRLHLGAVLTIPSYAEVAAISKAEAKREFHAQMAVWRSPDRTLHASTPATVLPAATVSAATVSAPTAPSTADAAAAPVAKAPAADTTVADDSILSRRVQSLEHELSEVQGLLETQNDKLAGMQHQVALVENKSHASEASGDAPLAAGAPPLNAGAAQAAAPLASVKSSQVPLVPVLGGIALLGAALAALYMRLRRRSETPGHSRLDARSKTPVAPAEDALADLLDAQAETVVRDDGHKNSRVNIAKDDEFDTQEAAAPVFDEDTQPLMPVMAANPLPKPANPMPKRVNNSAATISRPEPEGTTVNLRVDTVNLAVNGGVELTRVDATRLDYNLVDLDMTAQHVQMPSVLNEQVVAKERRTNLADVLKLAIEREPDRHDLRMKLLELYYAAAATNRQAFLEVVQKFANDRDYLQAEQWDKIAFMGRQIAAENPMFSDQSAEDDDLADCA